MRSYAVRCWSTYTLEKLPTLIPTVAPPLAKVNIIGPINARSRKPTTKPVSMASSSVYTCAPVGAFSFACERLWPNVP
jgi:hypothetical protein